LTKKRGIAAQKYAFQTTKITFLQNNYKYMFLSFSLTISKLFHAPKCDRSSKHFCKMRHKNVNKERKKKKKCDSFEHDGMRITLICENFNAVPRNWKKFFLHSS